MTKSSKNERNPDQLTCIVREYLNELANPSPCAIMRSDYRRRMAELVGVEDPEKVLRRWHSKPERVQP